jgi:hypothetical protein
MVNEPGDESERGPTLPGEAEKRRFLANLVPVIDALGCTVIAVDEAQHGDVPVTWEGETIAFVRGAELHGALERLVASLEREAGRPLEDMSRAQKQAAVRRLDDSGAFLLRGAVDDVAKMMGVSRVTLYSYLNAIRPGSG